MRTLAGPDNNPAGLQERPFWSELYSKKFGLFGQGWDGAAVPEKLIRHPWALRAAEFESALTTIVVDNAVPTNVSDDRAHVGTIVGETAGVGGLTAFVAGAIPASLAVAVGSGVMLRSELQSLLEQAHIKKNMPDFVEIYKREAAYRSVEVPKTKAPVQP